MNCTTCHNRVGHEFPSPAEAIDTAVTEGKISQSLPYIVREGVALLGKRYRSVGEADRAIEGIRGMYAAKYPLVLKSRGKEVNGAVDQLKQIYPLVADPAMNEISADYPNNLGHQSGPGCFRCHDGSHFEVGPDGRLLNKTIPWECTTCHTFPQVGKTVSNVSLLDPPPDHQSKLWVFEHAHNPLALQPSANSSFCANCHSSGAQKVNHEGNALPPPADDRKGRPPGVWVLPPGGILCQVPQAAGPGLKRVRQPERIEGPTRIGA